jgi:hypothetical protein
MLTANVAAAALRLVAGKPAHAICVHCLHATDPHEERYARMIPAGGDCELCPFSDAGFRGPSLGSDMFVVINPDLPQCPAQALTLELVRRLAKMGT